MKGGEEVAIVSTGTCLKAIWGREIGFRVPSPIPSCPGFQKTTLICNFLLFKKLPLQITLMPEGGRHIENQIYYTTYRLSDILGSANHLPQHTDKSWLLLLRNTRGKNDYHSH